MSANDDRMYSERLGEATDATAANKGQDFPLGLQYLQFYSSTVLQFYSSTERIVGNRILI